MENAKIRVGAIWDTATKLTSLEQENQSRENLPSSKKGVGGKKYYLQNERIRLIAEEEPISRQESEKPEDRNNTLKVLRKTTASTKSLQ